MDSIGMPCIGCYGISVSAVAVCSYEHIPSLAALVDSGRGTCAPLNYDSQEADMDWNGLKWNTKYHKISQTSSKLSKLPFYLTYCLLNFTAQDVNLAPLSSLAPSTKRTKRREAAWTTCHWLFTPNDHGSTPCWTLTLLEHRIYIMIYM